MKALYLLVVLAVLLSACGPQDIQDAARQEAERQAQAAWERAKKELENAINQQAEQKKDEIIRQYVGQGAPSETIDLFVQAFKRAWPGIGAPLGTVQHSESTDTYTQEFLGTDGKTLFVLSQDKKILYSIKDPWLSAYKEAGGVDVLGAPTNQIHQWNDGCASAECFGEVQNFGTREHTAILMHRQGTNEVFTLWGGAWLDAYLSMRNNGVVGYPLTNRKPYGETTGWLSWAGFGTFNQLGDMQLFITPNGPFALVLRKEGYLEGALYCSTANPADLKSNKSPCVSELKSPAPYPPIPTTASKDDDQQFINYVRGFYMYGTLDNLLITYGRPKGPKSLAFFQEGIRQDYIYHQVNEFADRAVALRTMLETKWDDSYIVLAADLLDNLLSAPVHWQQYEDFFKAHPKLKQPIGGTIQFLTGLSPEGDISKTDILINIAFLAIPEEVFLKAGKPLLRPAEAVLERVGDSWIVKQGTELIARISGRVIPKIALEELPAEAKTTLKLIEKGGPFPYDRDGIIFRNEDKLLPENPLGYYHEYTVETPGASNRALRRIITGQKGERYYTPDHYDSFYKIK